MFIYEEYKKLISNIVLYVYIYLCYNDKGYCEPYPTSHLNLMLIQMEFGVARGVSPHVIRLAEEGAIFV